MQNTPDISPFKFLDSYTKTDQEIFFGRENEVEEVYSKISQSKLLLIYGASGTGKSSIINCGLANKFDESDWLPIHIRRGGNILRSTYNQISKEAATPLSSEDVSKETIHKALSSVFLDHFKPIYLIFDQFEELFIFGQKDEWMEFIRMIQFLTETELEVHFLFVIRGEYLEFLSEFEELIPNFFDNRVRVEKMTRKNALKSITGPADLFSIQMDEGFEEKLLKKLSPGKTQVELTFLQVFLDKIYKNARVRSEDGSLTFTNEDIEQLGQVEDVLAEFVDEQLFNMPDPKSALSVLKSFVSMQGTKAQRSTSKVKDYLEDLGIQMGSKQIEEIIQRFVNTRILKDQDEQGRYELRHDTLAFKIYEKITLQERELLDVRQFLTHSLNEYKKREQLLSDDDLVYIAPHERTLKIDNETREFIELSKRKSGKRKRQRRTRTIVAVVILLLMVTSIFGFVFSMQQKNKAEVQADRANRESLEASRQREIAEEQRSIAQTNAVRAESEAQLAMEQRGLAEQNSILAQQAARRADEQRLIAENERTIAESERTRAELNAVEAEKQRGIAEAERQNALRLRMLALSRAMSIKSTHMVDPELKALLALQAYTFNVNFDGNTFQPDLYQSLYLARKEFFGGEYNRIQPSTYAIKSFTSDNEGNIYASTSNGSIFLVIPNNDSPAFENILSTEFLIESSVFSEDLKSLFLGTQQGEIVRIDLVSASMVFKKNAHDRDVSDMVLIDDNTIISGSLDGTVQFRDISGNLIRSLDLEIDIIDLEFNLANKQILVLSRSEGIIILDEYGKEMERVVVANQAEVVSFKVSPSAEILALGYQKGQVVVYDLSDWSPQQNLFGHTAAITDLRFDAQENHLVSSSFDRSVRVWKLDNPGEQAIVINDHDSWVAQVVLSNNQILTGNYDGTVKQYPLQTKAFTQGLCERIGRSLTLEEWNEHIATDLDYEPTCK